MSRRLAILGGGPTGVEAAVAAAERGYDVHLFERGAIGDAMRKWSHVHMFSPFEMNASELGRRKVHAEVGTLPNDMALLTGGQFATEYLEPLAATLGDRVRTFTEVLGIARTGVLKGELIGEPARMESPFRLLLHRGREEWNETADLIFDCTGTFATPNPLGDGGLNAVGERLCVERIEYGIPDVATNAYLGKRVLVVGCGHSAASVVRNLAALAGTRVIWLKRRNEVPPCAPIENDVLPARSELIDCANELVASGGVEFRPGCRVLAVARVRGGVEVRLATPDGETTEVVDRIVGATGFRPNLELARELQAKTCYATEGTFNLAAALLGEKGGDCLSIGGFGPETLQHP
jgi:thioredoxin reductase